MSSGNILQRTAYKCNSIGWHNSINHSLIKNAIFLIKSDLVLLIVIFMLENKMTVFLPKKIYDVLPRRHKSANLKWNYPYILIDEYKGENRE